MAIDGSIKINAIQLTNFRCFSNVSIDFHPDLTVLVADNAHGKTAILDAVGVSLGLFVDTITKWKQYPGFDRSDIRSSKFNGEMVNFTPVSIKADGIAGGVDISWERSLNSNSSRSRTNLKNAKELLEFANQLDREIKKGDFDVILPVIAFYGTGRLWNEHRMTKFRKKSSHIGTNAGRMGGYLDCLSSSSSFKEFAEWYGNAMREIADARFKTLEYGEHPIKWITSVRSAVKTVLEPTGWHSIDWDKIFNTIVAEHPENGRIPLNQMSDGIRSMISLIADLAHRCARLNPQLGENAAIETPGILLIDEIDMHLHPKWQQLVMHLLKKTFPKMQIIVTTHSPHVLTTVNKESIRIIEHFDSTVQIRRPDYQTKGVESADVLAVIMGVDPMPQVGEAMQLNKYRSLIEDGLVDSKEAFQLKMILIEHFGIDHPLMVDCERLIRFQALKKSPN